MPVWLSSSVAPCARVCLRSSDLLWLTSQPSAHPRTFCFTPYVDPKVCRIIQIDFYQVTHSGTALDNDFWVSRKRAAVIRFGASTWRLHNQFEGDEEKFKAKIGLGETATQYAIHGGGVPVYVKSCDTPVAVVVVSGLKQWDDHQVVIEELEKVCKAL
jgi:uncharacterized protein (UPF0303 family)